MIKLILALIITLNCFAFNLKFNNFIVLKKKIAINGNPLGGLSGIRFSKTDSALYAISDDRSQKGPARFYKFIVKVDSQQVSISNPSEVILKDEAGKNFKVSSIDFEDIEIRKNGNLIITSEGNIMGNNIYPPRIINFSKSGKYLSDISVDDKFIPKKVNGYFTSGTKNNMAFEPLSFTPSRKSLFTSPEECLEQDNEKASFSKVAPVRFIKYQKDDKEYTQTAEYVYNYGPIEKVGPITKDSLVFSGIPGILAISQTDLLVLERTYYPLSNKTKVIMNLASIASDTTDVKSYFKLPQKDKYTAMKKVQILDFDSLLHRIGHVDNIEGICFGPKLPNGNDTLILVSDNNFSNSQETYFIILEIQK